MTKFFTSPKDIENWVRENRKDAVNLITAILQDDQNHQDVQESVQSILDNRDAEHAGVTLFNLFAQHKIVEQNIRQENHVANKKVQVMKTAQQDNSQEKSQGLVKQAQIMRQPGEYPMKLRVCPKLPASVGGRLISTYNCRHYCLDSIVLDDDADRVYCAEALWRKHIMDKFSREWMEPKTGQYVGGYINNRFHVFPDAGTPDNPDVPRDQGNRMTLAPQERTRQVQPHEYSMERRLEENRDKGSVKPLTLTASEDLRNALYAQAESKGFVKIASSDIKNPPASQISDAFAEAVELHQSGVPADEALAMISKNNNLKVETAYKIQSMALRKVTAHGTDVYMIKTAAVPASAPQQVIPNGGNLTTSEGYVLPQGTTFSVLSTDGHQTKLQVLMSPDPMHMPVGPVTVNAQDLAQINPTSLRPEDAAAHMADVSNQAAQAPVVPPIDQAAIASDDNQNTGPQKGASGITDDGIPGKNF